MTPSMSKNDHQGQIMTSSMSNNDTIKVKSKRHRYFRQEARQQGRSSTIIKPPTDNPLSGPEMVDKLISVVLPNTELKADCYTGTDISIRQGRKDLSCSNEKSLRLDNPKR